MKFKTYLNPNMQCLLSCGQIKFVNGVYETDDENIIEELKKIPIVFYEKDSLLDTIQKELNEHEESKEYMESNIIVDDNIEESLFTEKKKGRPPKNK